MSKEAEFTPGPWAFVVGTPGYRRKSSVKTIEVLSATSLIPVVAWPGFDEGERSHESHVANARLISAAPDLFAACKDVVNCHDNLGEDALAQAVSMCRAAIAKAEGGRK